VKQEVDTKQFMVPRVWGVDGEHVGG
jgi:hypothetical protein